MQVDHPLIIVSAYAIIFVIFSALCIYHGYFEATAISPREMMDMSDINTLLYDAREAA